MRILIVKLSSFGDVVHTFPALTDLAAARPGVEIDWLVEEALAPIARLHPAVGEIHAVALRRLRWPPVRWPDLIGGTLALYRRLRARQYDLIVDLQGLVKSALPARMAGAPVIGYDRESAREPAAARFYTRSFRIEKNLHATERSRRLLAAAVGYPVPASADSFGLPPRRRRPDGVPARFGMAIHGASWPTKLWPEELWRALIAQLAAVGVPVLLPWGDAEEKARAKRLASGIAGAHVLAEISNGAALADLIGAADFAVGLDSGLMHLANALAVPGVWLYGPTDPALSGPYGRNQHVVRSTHPLAPCRRRRCADEPGGQCCMRAIALERVEAALDACLGGDLHAG